MAYDPKRAAKAAYKGRIYTVPRNASTAEEYYTKQRSYPPTANVRPQDALRQTMVKARDAGQITQAQFDGANKNLAEGGDVDYVRGKLSQALRYNQAQKNRSTPDANAPMTLPDNIAPAGAIANEKTDNTKTTGRGVNWGTSENPNWMRKNEGKWVSTTATNEQPDTTGESEPKPPAPLPSSLPPPTTEPPVIQAPKVPSGTAPLSPISKPENKPIADRGSDGTNSYPSPLAASIARQREALAQRKALQGSTSNIGDLRQNENASPAHPLRMETPLQTAGNAAKNYVKGAVGLGGDMINGATIVPRTIGKAIQSGWKALNTPRPT